jgi:hypothetical protein
VIIPGSSISSPRMTSYFSARAFLKMCFRTLSDRFRMSLSFGPIGAITKQVGFWVLDIVAPCGVQHCSGVLGFVLAKLARVRAERVPLRHHGPRPRALGVAAEVSIV